jgi:hypothetical protein
MMMGPLIDGPGSPSCGRVQDDIGQRPEVLGLEAFAEMESETVIPRRPGRRLQRLREDERGDKPVRIGKGRAIESERVQDLIRIAPPS